jgi:DnaJ-class molecular chaperone
MPTPRKAVCQRCMGSGWLDQETWNDDVISKRGWGARTCTACDGTGEVTLDDEPA